MFTDSFSLFNKNFLYFNYSPLFFKQHVNHLNFVDFDIKQNISSEQIIQFLSQTKIIHSKSFTAEIHKYYIQSRNFSCLNYFWEHCSFTYKTLRRSLRQRVLVTSFPGQLFPSFIFHTVIICHYSYLKLKFYIYS